MKSLFNHFGLFYKADQSNPYTYDISQYTINGDEAKLSLHREFLKSKEDEENDRLSLIENKTSQLVSQTGIIFSLLGLFTPLLIDRISDVSTWLKIALLLILFFSFLFYMLTIRNALKNFNVKKFIYSKSSPSNVIKLQNYSREDFLIEEIKDLLYAINQNTKTNNQKATNLLHSYAAFKAANTLTGLLVCAFCILFLFFNSNSKEPQINVVKIQNLDSITQRIDKLLKNNEMKKDTVYIYSDSSKK